MEGFKLDLSDLDWVEARKLGISIDEIHHVFDGNATNFFTIDRTRCALGFSEKRKFVMVAFRVAENPNFDLKILQVDLPYEEDIKNYWCRQRT